MATSSPTMNSVLQPGPTARARARAKALEALPPWYGPWIHLALPSLMGLGAIAFAVTRIHGPGWREVLAVPVVWITSSIEEWYAHRYILHRPTKGLGVLHESHVGLHHRLFTAEDMAIRSARELHLVLMSSPAFLAVVGLCTLPGLALAAVGQRDLGLVFFATSIGYVVVYEWLHLLYHLRPESWIGRWSLVRRLARRHAAHHVDPSSNFNVTFPLWDWVQGTLRHD